MPRRFAVLLMFLLALSGLAGCGAVVDEASSLTGETHPFAGETVTVAVEGTDRERALAADGLAYWADNASQYAGFDVTFRLVDPAVTPTNGTDVRLRFVETVGECGDTTYPAGCAPRINASTGVDRPATVEVKRGLADDPTRLVVRHEVGHLLGLTHTDRPQDVMHHQRDLASLPQPDATQRVNPWNDTTLRVALLDGGPDHREGVETALAYVNSGADGAVPSNVSARLVEDPDSADVVVRPVASDDCTTQRGSCRFLSGSDPDRDGAVETYTRQEIRLVGLDPDATSWHVAWQLVRTFNTGDAPDRLQAADQYERRGDWDA